MKHVHFIGVGGVGMNGLAQLSQAAGYEVSGSDRTVNSVLLTCLKKMGVRIVPQDGSGIQEPTSQVVFSTAIEQDNPDLQKAQQYGIPLLHRAEFLNQLVGGSKLIAVAGTAGKTTTTGMLGWLLEQLELNPTVYNGAAVLNWKSDTNPGNVRTGNRNLWVIEADESDKSFLRFHPEHSIITNISRDHYELDELQDMFDQFRAQTAETIIEGNSHPLEQTGPQSFSYRNIEFSITLTGRHNLENAQCAVRMCEALDLDLHKVRDALARFKGIERRLEMVGIADGVTIMDDYAHNAAKIAAALSAVSGAFEQVQAYWRPHGFTPLYQGMSDLIEIFTEHWKSTGGTVYILPVYYAGGTVQRKTTSEDLVHRLNSAGIPVEYVPDYDVLGQRLRTQAGPGSAILGMGARDPQLPLFAHKLVEEWKNQ
ncbi:MAG: hypothetical protein JXR25_06305 [Pontiellaceae bacterium]|nr:hypothetical protein [Pontiellaceae bacterium]MBN2784421.1 hypothetical protein [Pontiellaceae bacterium]